MVLQFLCNGFEDDAVARHMELSSSPLDELDMLVNGSGKMYVMNQLLEKLKREGHKVLIFSQFKIMLDILEDFLRLKNHGFERIDGNTAQRERQAAIDRFTRANEDSFVFLLSTRAGGSGITLTAADTVIIYDSDWNPQNDLQAMARCHRIGQDREVIIYRMITWDTYEQQLFECASRKYGLEEAVLGKYDPSDPQTNSKKIFELLKNGAHVLSSTEDKNFVAEDIDQILKNRSEKRQIGSRAGNTFSEVTFAVSSHENRDYWTSLLPEAVASTKKAAISPMGKRRMKRRVNYSEGRKCKGSDSEASQGFVCDNDASDGSTSCDNDQANVSVEKLPASNRSKWSCKDLKEFLDSYLAFGPGRWAMVVRKPYNSCLLGKPSSEIDEASICIHEILKRSEAEINSRDHLPSLHKLVLSPDDKDFSQVPPSEAEAKLKCVLSEIQVPTFLEGAFEAKGILRLFAFKGHLFWEHTRKIKAAVKLLQAQREDPDSEEARIPYNGTFCETRKFSKDDDLAILKGVHEHGFSCWHPSKFIDFMLEDHELGLYNLMTYGIKVPTVNEDSQAPKTKGLLHSPI